MKLPRKAAGAVGIAAVMTFALAGCTSGSGGEGSDDPLLWWATQQSSSIADSEAAWNATADRYTEETGIEVEVEVIPWADLYNRILTAVSSGTGPDVLNIGTSWTASLQDTGAFAPVTGANLEAMGGSERFVPTAWEAAHVPDTDQAVVPLLSSVYALYYNTALFEAAGIPEPPTTWEEFVEYGKQLTIDTNGDGTIDQWGYSGAGAALTSNAHQAFALGAQEGGSFVDDEGNPTLSSADQSEGITRYIDLMATDQIMSPSDAENNSGYDSVDKLINGQAAMVIQQNPIEQITSRGFEDWDVAGVPVVEGGDNVQSMIGGVNVVVFEDSGNIEAAFDFVRHLTSPEEQSFLADAFRFLPVVSEAYDVSPFSDNGDASVPVRREILEDASAPFPLVSNIADIERAAGDAIRLSFQTFATGGAPDIEAQLRQADEQLR